MTARFLAEANFKNSIRASKEIRRYLADVPFLVRIADEARGLTGVLTSFWYFRKFDLNKLGSCRVIADSGAFSAYTSGAVVTPGDYADWLDQWPDRFEFAFNLDVLGDPAQSLANWQALQDRGHLTVPVIHYGDRPEDVLPAYLNRTDPADRLAFGGIAVSGASTQVKAWCAYVFRWLRDNAPDLPTHGLGVHMKSKLAAFPWTTTDSSSFGSAWRFGRAVLWDPDHLRWVGYRLDGKDVYRVGRITRRYGVEPGEVAESTGETRDTLVRMVTRSECRAAQDWGRRAARKHQRRKP